MKKLTQKRLIVILLIVLITAFSAYPVYLMSWYINESSKSLSMLNEQLERWESYEPNEEYSERDISNYISYTKTYIRDIQKARGEFSCALSSFIAAYVFVFLLLFFISNPLKKLPKSNTKQCHHRPEDSEDNQTPPTP